MNNKRGKIGSNPSDTIRGNYLYGQKLDFKITNNMAEYEVCIYGMEAALAVEAKYLLVYGDSFLVIS